MHWIVIAFRNDCSFCWLPKGLSLQQGWDECESNSTVLASQEQRPQGVCLPEVDKLDLSHHLTGASRYKQSVEFIAEPVDHTMGDI